LAIISEHVYHELRLINQVRVTFAHSKKVTSFDDPEISVLLRKIRLEPKITGSGAIFIQVKGVGSLFA
jgi:hypothetical protein